MMTRFQPSFSRLTIVFCSGILLSMLAPALACADNLSSENPSHTHELKALIVEGQNNHGVWPKTSLMMKRFLEDTKLFSVEIMRTAKKGVDQNFEPDFSKYDVVVSNYNGAPWPETTQTAFVNYMKNGGGLVVIHAADNAFPNWREYNEMIGLGGWGGRSEKSGPYVYYSDAENSDEQVLVRIADAGRGGGHGRQHEFSIVTRTEHPITQGLPTEWMHSKDELYDKLRGPAQGFSILATAYSNPKTGGSGRHEPMLMTIEYGKGRVFHSTLGHAVYSQECVGFMTTFQRGAEWAATGKVTIPVPKDFPTPDNVSVRKFVENETQTNGK